MILGVFFLTCNCRFLSEFVRHRGLRELGPAVNLDSFPAWVAQAPSAFEPVAVGPRLWRVIAALENASGVALGGYEVRSGLFWLFLFAKVPFYLRFCHLPMPHEVDNVENAQQKVTQCTDNDPFVHANFPFFGFL